MDAVTICADEDAEPRLVSAVLAMFLEAYNAMIDQAEEVIHDIRIYGPARYEEVRQDIGTNYTVIATWASGDSMNFTDHYYEENGVLVSSEATEGFYS